MIIVLAKSRTSYSVQYVPMDTPTYLKFNYPVSGLIEGNAVKKYEFKVD